MPPKHASLYTSAFGIELADTFAGRLSSLDPGIPGAETFTQSSAGELVLNKRANLPIMPATTFTCGAGMSRTFYAWLKQTFDDKPTPTSVAVGAFDMKGNHRWGLEFAVALLSEVSFPALDGASKDAAKLSVKIAPEVAKMTTSGGSVRLGAFASAAAKRWQVSDFRLTIDGLDAACRNVTRIEPVGAKVTITRELVGKGRVGDIHAGRLIYSDLVITVPSASARPLLDWHEDFVVQGNNGGSNEKSGSLEYLAPGSTKPYFQVDFKNLGIHTISTQSGGSAVKAELFCEDIDFHYFDQACAG